MNRRLSNIHGLGLIELMVLLIVVSILISIALQSMTSSLIDFKKIKTEREMEQLAVAITGNPENYSSGTRSEFGYVGDIGSFPPDLNALRKNPGGYASWDGPYLPPDIVEDSLGYKTDEWGTAYVYSGGISIQSTGSGSTLSKEVARSANDFLLNSLSGTIVDSLGTPPGGELDSVRLIVTIPNGIGTYNSKIYNPDSTGNFLLDSIPVGQHQLDIIYTTANDTLHRFVHILPRHRSRVQYKFASSWFDTTLASSSGLELVPGSAIISGIGSNCDNIEFDVQNIGTTDIDITSMTLTYSAPVSYYKMVFIGVKNVFASQTPRKASGEAVTFSAETITAGSTVTIKFSDFCNNPSGNCSGRTNMSSASFTVDFSDGSSVSFGVGMCP